MDEWNTRTHGNLRPDPAPCATAVSAWPKPKPKTIAFLEKWVPQGQVADLR